MTLSEKRTRPPIITSFKLHGGPRPDTAAAAKGIEWAKRKVDRRKHEWHRRCWRMRLNNYQAGIFYVVLETGNSLCEYSRTAFSHSITRVFLDDFAGLDRSAKSM